MPALKVLLVEDFEPFRRIVRSLLQQRAEIKLVVEASDGAEALQKAQEIQPHLVLLDINIPKPNGLEVAKRIRDLVPRAKILFLSQEFSSGLVNEIFRLGALGYVQKMLAAGVLLPAVDAVLAGRQFVSGSMPFGNTKFHHEAQLYFHESALIDALTDLTHAALREGKAAIVIATESHRTSLERKLERLAVHTAKAKADGQFICLDAARTLSRLVDGGLPDPERFSETIGGLISKARSAAQSDEPRVTVFGEMVALLWAAGNHQAAIRLEELWNELGPKHNFSLRCAYPTRRARGTETTQLILNVCPVHTAIRSI